MAPHENETSGPFGQNQTAPADSRNGGQDVVRLVGIICRELAALAGNESLSDRSRRTMWMVDGLLRYIATTGLNTDDADAGPGGTGLSAVQDELAAIAQCGAAEAAMPIPAHTAEQSDRLAVDDAALTVFLKDRGLLGEGARVSKVEKLLGGFSKETFLIDFAGEPGLDGAVMRRDVEFGPVDSSVVDEFPLLKALHLRGLTVAEPLFLEADPDAMGMPFLLSARAAGSAPSNTEGLEMKPEQIHAARQLAKFLGQLHALRIDDLALGGRWSEPGLSLHDHLVWEIDAIDRSWRRHGANGSAIVATALDWLKHNIPDTTGECAAIVHGDAGLHNLLMDGGQISAMLDWELAHPGDPTEDLAYCRTWVDQVLDWDEFLEIYRANGGQPYHAERERFYGILADLRVVGFALRATDHVERCGQPELPQAFAAIYYSRIFRTKVGQRLLQALDGTA